MSGRAQLRTFADEPLVRLVDRIYQGATDAAAWPGIVTAVAGFVGTPVGRLFTPFDCTAQGGLSITCGAEGSEPAGSAHRDPRDAWAQTQLGRHLFYEGSVVIDADLAPPRTAGPSSHADETAASRAFGRLCSGVVFDRRSAAVPPTVYSAYRDPEWPAFGEIERRRMKLVLPHLSRALRVMYRLRDAEQKVAASLSALDRLACGVFLLDSAGEVLHLNREAERILAQEDGLALRRETHRTRLRLAASDPGDHNALQSALAAALDQDATAPAHCTRGIEAKRASGKRPYVLHVARLPETSGFATEVPACTLVLVNDSEARDSLDPGILQQLYGVTPAEARLANRLLAGDTLAAAAARCGISQTTARTQLCAVFQKTGTHRQAELMRLLVSLAASSAPQPPFGAHFSRRFPRD